MSRSILLATGGVMLLASVSPALAQPAPQQSSDDLVCQLAGQCDAATGQAPSAADANATGQAPAADGGGEARPGRRTSATRGFSIGAGSGAAASASASDKPAFRIVPSATNSRANAASTRYSAPAARNAPSGGRKAPHSAAPAREAGRADLLITFVSGSSTLTDQAKANAQQLVSAMRSPLLANTKFAIEGHTDAAGSRESNLLLSQQRAQAVVDYLVASGADRARFEIHGYGFDRPIDRRNPRSAANRRVEVVKVK